ncbi:unnamed protein product, partial [Rhizoctonia solani]
MTHYAGTETDTLGFSRSLVACVRQSQIGWRILPRTKHSGPLPPMRTMAVRVDQGLGPGSVQAKENQHIGEEVTPCEQEKKRWTWIDKASLLCQTQILDQLWRIYGHLISSPL